MKRIIALDVGDVRIGVASSDYLQIISSPFTTYVRKNTDEDFEFFKNLVEERDAETVVVGLPLKLDGTDSEQTKKVRDFVIKLKEFVSVPIVFEDERMTTVVADEILNEGNVKRGKRKMNVDKIAASVILQDYLSKKKS